MELTKTRPWYREPWVWLLIALPMSAVIAGMVTLYLAVITSDGLVVDDYYKRGKTINLELARDRVATSLQLQAILRINAQGGRVRVTLESAKPLRPDFIRLLLWHPARAGLDQRVQLEPEGNGVYGGPVSELPAANWHVLLETDDWRLYGRAQLPLKAPYRLAAQPAPGAERPVSR